MAFKARSKAEADAIVMHQRSAATGQQVAGIKTDVANVKSDTGNILTDTGLIKSDVANVMSDIRFLHNLIAGNVLTDTGLIKSDLGNIKNTLDMILGVTVCFYVIKDVDGTPINGAQVTFHLSGSADILASTDASGAAFVRGIPPSATSYAYTVKAAGYTDMTNKPITVNGDCLKIVEMVGT